MVTCPVCGLEIPRRDIRREGFACPKCKERLRLQAPGGHLLVMAGSAAMAVLIPYLVGAQGYDFLWYAIVLYFLISAACGALRGWLFPRLEREPPEDNGRVLRIGVPPDSSDKS